MVEYFVFNTGVGTAEITLREKIRKLKPGSGHQEFHPGAFGLVNWGLDISIGPETGWYVQTLCVIKLNRNRYVIVKKKEKNEKENSQ